MTRPGPDEYAAPYADYVGLVTEDDVVTLLEVQLGEALALLGPVSGGESLVRHAPYTWSLREVVGHLTDAERVFGFRAHHIARNDSIPLPGFDENGYVASASFDRVSLPALVAEFQAARQANLWLFKNLGEEAWPRSGIVNGYAVTVRALAAIIAGHARHHLHILTRRLAPAAQRS